MCVTFMTGTYLSRFLKALNDSYVESPLFNEHNRKMETIARKTNILLEWLVQYYAVEFKMSVKQVYKEIALKGSQIDYKLSSPSSLYLTWSEIQSKLLDELNGFLDNTSYCSPTKDELHEAVMDSVDNLDKTIVAYFNKTN